MLELYQLRQLVAVAEWGTVSRAAEQLHLSQPALSRSLQKLEESFQVPLFDRKKNKIALNQNGEMAVAYARQILGQAQDMTERVRAFARSQHTILIGSCAPVPLWEIPPQAAALYPEMTIASEMKSLWELEQGIRDGTYTLAVLPKPMKEEGVYSFYWGKERLFLSLPSDHSLARRDAVYFKDLAGESMLLYSQIGFWHEMHRRMMPDTRFLLQEERSAFNELVKGSSFPAFTSDVSMRRDGIPEKRVILPILDPEAGTDYYCVCRDGTRQKFKKLVSVLEKGMQM